MVSVDVALQTDRPLAGLIVFSGTFLAEPVWGPKMASRAGLAVYQSHGRFDSLLPFAVAEALRDALTSAGLDVEFEAFDGEHQIPASVIDNASRFLRRALSSSDR